MRRALIVPIVAVTLSLVSGTAHAATLDTRATRREIARQVEASYQGLAFGNVACPDGVARKSGTRFTCTVQLPGAFLVFDATQTDGRGTVTFKNTQAGDDAGGGRAVRRRQRVAVATVTCGTAVVLVVRPGDQLTCQASIADGTQRTVHLTVRDTAGNVTITGVT